MDNDTFASDTGNAVTAGKALWQAAGGKVTQAELANMLAICGRETGWDAGAVQAGPIGPYTGWGWWQITPGDPSLLEPAKQCAAVWALMCRDPANPYEPWNLQSDGRTLIYPWGTLPNGQRVAEHPPSDYCYEVGAAAAAIAWQEEDMNVQAKYVTVTAGAGGEGFANIDVAPAKVAAVTVEDGTGPNRIIASYAPVPAHPALTAIVVKGASPGQQVTVNVALYS